MAGKGEKERRLIEQNKQQKRRDEREGSQLNLGVGLQSHTNRKKTNQKAAWRQDDCLQDLAIRERGEISSVDKRFPKRDNILQLLTWGKFLTNWDPKEKGPRLKSLRKRNRARLKKWIPRLTSIGALSLMNRGRGGVKFGVRIPGTAHDIEGKNLLKRRRITAERKAREKAERRQHKSGAGKKTKRKKKTTKRKPCSTKKTARGRAGLLTIWAGGGLSKNADDGVYPGRTGE